MVAERIIGEVVLDIAPHRVDVISPVLAVVELDQEIAAVNPIVMRLAIPYGAGLG